METLRLIEPYRNLFYSTLYVARSLDLFQEAGLGVEVRTRSLDEDVLETLRLDQADVVLTGPMRLLLDAEAGNWPLARNFIEVNSRDGFILLARKPEPDFQWSSLEGQTVLIFRDPPTPWMCLLRVLAEQGVDRGKVNLIEFPSVPAALSAFQTGFGDFIELPEPQAEELLESGVYHLATPMARHAGHLAFTSFAALPARLEERQVAFLAFTRAIYAAQRFMKSTGVETIAGAAAEFLPGNPLPRLVAGAHRYQAESAWAQHPLLRRESFDRLRDILRDGGLISGEHRFEDHVDTGLAESVLAEAG